ncbi:MAG: hypothetical protein K6T83_10485 [Alicyclobacillus sp.]|nr:hypothetical protein [Alicyclobacillus sp.]
MDGIIWSVVRTDLVRIGIFVLVTLVFGLVFKPHINRLASGMARKARESRLIH